jgi:hypothetical protein
MVSTDIGDFLADPACSTAEMPITIPNTRSSAMAIDRIFSRIVIPRLKLNESRGSKLIAPGMHRPNGASPGTWPKG